MKEIARLPFFKIKFKRTPPNTKKIKYRRRGTLWRPFWGDRNTQILWLFFPHFSVNIEIRWRGLFLNKKRGVEEIYAEMCEVLGNEDPINLEFAKIFSSVEKRSWYITLF